MITPPSRLLISGAGAPKNPQTRDVDQWVVSLQRTRQRKRKRKSSLLISQGHHHHHHHHSGPAPRDFYSLPALSPLLASSGSQLDHSASHHRSPLPWCLDTHSPAQASVHNGFLESCRPACRYFRPPPASSCSRLGPARSSRRLCDRRQDLASPARLGHHQCLSPGLAPVHQDLRLRGPLGHSLPDPQEEAR